MERKKIAHKWNKIFNEDTFAVARFKAQKGKTVAFFDISATKPGKHSNRLIFNIQGLRRDDQDLLTGLNKEEINDISPIIGDNIPNRKALLESYTQTETETESESETETESSPSKRIMS